MIKDDYDAMTIKYEDALRVEKCLDLLTSEDGSFFQVNPRSERLLHCHWTVSVKEFL